MPRLVIDAPGGASLVPLPETGGGSSPPPDTTKENLLAYGADRTGSTPSDTAVVTWLGAIASSGKVGYVPAGDYLINTAKVQTFARNARIEGDGAGVSRFICAAGATFTFTMNKDPSLLDGNGDALFQQYRLYLGGLSFLTRGNGADDAVTVNYGFSQSMTDRGLIAENLQFRGDDQQAQGWKRGIVGNNLWNPTFNDISFKGRNQPIFPFDSQRAIYLYQPQAPLIRGLNVYHTEAALEVSGAIYCEGLNISRFEWVGVRHGAILSGTAVKAAGTTIDHGHINAYERGIIGANLRMLNISDILFLKAPWSGYWQGVSMSSCEGVDVHNCRFRGNPGSPGGNDCVVFQGVQRGSITNIDGGDFASVGAVAILLGGSDSNDVFDNRRGTNCSSLALIGQGMQSNRTRNT